MDQSATAFKLFEDVHVVTGDESSTITQKGQLKGATSSKLTTGTDTKYYMVSPANFKTAVDTLVATKGIGVSQTWQDMSGSRAVSTVYQNTTGKPIQVNVDTNADVVL